MSLLKLWRVRCRSQMACRSLSCCERLAWGCLGHLSHSFDLAMCLPGNLLRFDAEGVRGTSGVRVSPANIALTPSFLATRNVECQKTEYEACVRCKVFCEPFIGPAHTGRTTRKQVRSGRVERRAQIPRISGVGGSYLGMTKAGV